MDFAAPFRGRGTLTSAVAFVDDSAVEDIFSQGHAEEGGRVREEFDRLEGGEGVEGC